MADEPVRVGGILLAAGSSSRLGRPKQLLQFQGDTLLRRAAFQLTLSLCRPRIVVLGAETLLCRKELAGLDVDICVNEEWQTGMSSSIKAGLSRILELDSAVDAVIIMLVDQPYISAEVLDRSIDEYRRIRPGIVASEYNGIRGVPALFSREMFEGILELDGDKGARALIRDAGERAVTIDVPEAGFDIDSPADLDRLINAK